MPTQTGRLLHIDRRNVTMEIITLDGEDAKRSKVTFRAEESCLDAAVSLLGKEVVAEIKSGRFTSFKPSGKKSSD